MRLKYSNMPRWMKHNLLVKKLYLLKKMHFTKSKASHYSQFAEDISIGQCFRNSSQGFFVDVGCFHPKKYNNTWLLYKQGWRGINIDIDSIKIDGFNLARPQDTNICCAVSNMEGEISYFSSGHYSLTTSVDKNFSEARGSYVEKKTRCAKLTTLLDGTKYKDRQIDFLSVDAEGHDLEVLMSLDFQRYDPRLIAVETHAVAFTEVCEAAVYQYLLGKGYCLVGWCGLTLLMANKAMQEARAIARRREPPYSDQRPESEHL